MSTHDQPTVLVLGGSPIQQPLVAAIRQRNGRAVVVDGDPSRADIAVSFTDTVRVQQLLSARDIAVTAIASIGADRAVVPWATLAQQLQVAGPTLDVARRATDKVLMHRCLTEANVATTSRLTVATAGELLASGTPVVVKPADASGQRGVALVRSSVDLETAISLARSQSATDREVIEQLVAGPEFTIDGISIGGDPHVLLVTRRHHREHGQLGIPAAHAYPPTIAGAPLTEQLATAIERVAVASVAALGIASSAWHVEVRLDAESGEPVVIEVASRLCGGQLSRVINDVTGYDAVGAVLDLALDHTPPPPPPLDAVPHVAHAYVAYEFADDDGALPPERTATTIVHAAYERTGAAQH